MKLIIRLIINAIALWAAAYLVNGIHLTDKIGGVLIVALIFGLINAIIRPILKLLSFPFIIVTLGLFTLVINALMLMLTDALASDYLAVAGFGAAFWGAIVISLVSWLLNVFLKDDKEDRKERR